MKKLALLLSSMLFLLPTHGTAKIMEVSMTVDNFDCQLCPKEFSKILLRDVRGVEKAQAWEPEGVAIATWKENVPFQAHSFFRAMAKTKFFIRELSVEVEGLISSKACSMMLTSAPEKSQFIIDNRADSLLDNVKNGDTLHCKGRVSSIQGFNFMVVTEVIAHSPAKEEQKK
jgi:hypothetical protein